MPKDIHTALQAASGWSNPDFPFSGANPVLVTNESGNSRFICPVIPTSKLQGKVLHRKDCMEETARDKKYLCREKDIQDVDHIGQSNKD